MVMSGVAVGVCRWLRHENDDQENHAEKLTCSEALNKQNTHQPLRSSAQCSESKFLVIVWELIRSLASAERQSTLSAPALRRGQLLTS